MRNQTAPGTIRPGRQFTPRARGKEAGPAPTSDEQRAANLATARSLAAQILARRAS